MPKVLGQCSRCNDGGVEFLTVTRVFILVREMKQQLASCGRLCLRSIANAPLLTLIFGQRMGQCYRANDIERLEKKRVRPATLSDSTIRCVNEYLVWCEKPCPFPNHQRITLVQFGILFITTIWWTMPVEKEQVAN